MLPLPTRLVLVTVVYLTALASTSMAATANTIVDDSPSPPILLSGDPEQNPIVHLGSVDRTITVRTTPLCPYDVHLDGQWQGSIAASDGKVYFGTSSHAPHTSALFMQYDPATGLVHRLSSLNEITHEDPGYYRPQGKLHSAVIEYNGYLYFSTYYGYEGGGYPGGHGIRYKLGSFEANGVAKFDDMGIPRNGGTIYTATTIDPLNGVMYVNSDNYIYSCPTNGVPDNGTFTWTNRGYSTGTCFYHFTDGLSNLWTAPFYTNGQLCKVPAVGSLVAYPAAMPISRRPDNLAQDPMWCYQGFSWIGRIDQDHWVFWMMYDCFFWMFDCNEARQGHFAEGQAYKKICRIGVTGLDTCMYGHTIYWLTSARRWYSRCQYLGPNDPDTTWYNYTGDDKAKDHRLMSLNLDDPRLTAPGFDPNYPDPNIFTDWGRLVDQDGRTPYRAENGCCDGKHIYIVGDWRNLPTDPNNWHTLKALYADIDGGYQQIWRGQFFGVINLPNQPPQVSLPANITAAMPSAANPGAVALSAAVSDDGQVSPLACTWSVLSAPANGTVAFTNANQASTTASFDRSGAYQLQLDANDGALHTAATMTVTVQLDPRGDFDSSGMTDGSDFLTWQRNYNHGTAASGAPIVDANFGDPNYAKANGDANGDGKVDGQDFLIWQQDYMYGH